MWGRGEKIETNTIQVRNAQADQGSKSHVLINITMFTYITPVKCNVQICNSRKFLAKGFGLVIGKI